MRRISLILLAVMAGLLRIAIGLDRGHRSVVGEVRAELDEAATLELRRTA